MRLTLLVLAFLSIVLPLIADDCFLCQKEVATEKRNQEFAQRDIIYFSLMPD